MRDQDENQLVKKQLIRLASDNLEIYKSAYSWFVQQGPEITTALVHGLDDELLGSVCHWRILLLLSHFAKEETLPAILETLRLALDRRDYIVIPRAMEALVVFRAPEATNALIRLLQHNDSDIAKHAAALLGKTGDLNAIEPLLRLLGSDDPSIRYSAARGLTQFDDSSVRAALKRHLESETDVEVRELIESAGMGALNKGD